MSELFGSFTLWAGLSVAFAGWIMGYAYHIETRRVATQPVARRPLRHTLAQSIVSRPN